MITRSCSGAALSPITFAIWPRAHIEFPWVSRMPLGRPVVPEE